MTRRQRTHPLCALALLLLVATGCVDSDQPEFTAPDTHSSSLNPDLLPRFRNTDEEFSFYAKGTIPGGFGGYYFDSQKRPTMYLVDMTRRVEAVAALTSVLQVYLQRHPGKHLNLSDIQVLQGQYDFATLRAWRKTLDDALFQAYPGVQMSDVDERRNRVVIGVADSETAAQVETALAGTDVPRAAVMIEQVEPMRLTKTLQDYTYKVEGGYVITYDASGKTGVCSMGFSGYLDGEFGFFTAGHCSSRIGMDSPAEKFYQGSEIGVEKYDREARWYTDPSLLGNCPENKYCKWADVLFANWTVPDRSAFGRIARTDDFHSITIDPTYPNFEVVGQAAYPIGGESLQKMGMITGWTFGRVDRTCKTQTSVDTGIVYICQDELTGAASEKGDSGGPIFDKLGGEVILYGISWTGGSQATTFSSISNIENELYSKIVKAHAY